MVGQRYVLAGRAGEPHYAVRLAVRLRWLCNNWARVIMS